MLIRLLFAITALFFVSNGLSAKVLYDSSYGKLHEGATIVIRTTVDLKGESVKIPKNCTLVFKRRGRIANGTLIGNETSVKCVDKRVHFLNSLTLEGDWCSEVAYSEWFDAIPDCKLSSDGGLLSGSNNYRSLQNLFRFNNVVVKKGYYYIKGNLKTERNDQIIDGRNACIKGDFINRYSGVLSINADSVTVRNLTIIGVRDESNEKTQWAHGVVVERASDITLENVNCRNCRGDGFNITETNLPRGLIWPERIILNNCKAENNYRNGLSITGGHSVEIRNSSFSSTIGQDPQAGIDIEPNVYKKGNTIVTSECSDIVIKNCSFSANYRTGLIMQAPVDCEEINTFPVRDIRVEGCVFQRNSISLWRLMNVAINGCNVQTKGFCHGIVFQDAEQSNISIKDVTISNTVAGEPQKIGIFVCPGHKRNHLSFNNVNVAGAFEYCIFIPSDEKYKNTITDVSFENIKVCNGGHNFFVGNIVKNADYSEVRSLNRGVSIDGKKYKDWDWGWSIHKHND